MPNSLGPQRNALGRRWHQSPFQDHRFGPPLGLSRLLFSRVRRTEAARAARMVSLPEAEDAATDSGPPDEAGAVIGVSDHLRIPALSAGNRRSGRSCRSLLQRDDIFEAFPYGVGFRVWISEAIGSMYHELSDSEQRISQPQSF